MLNIIDELIDRKWDERHWDISMLSKDKAPTEVYAQIKADLKSAKETTPIDDLPPEQRDWYRST